jgi:hypothetical protein
MRVNEFHRFRLHSHALHMPIPSTICGTTVHLAGFRNRMPTIMREKDGLFHGIGIPRCFCTSMVTIPRFRELPNEEDLRR